MQIQISFLAVLAISSATFVVPAVAASAVSGSEDLIYRFSNGGPHSGINLYRIVPSEQRYGNLVQSVTKGKGDVSAALKNPYQTLFGGAGKDSGALWLAFKKGGKAALTGLRNNGTGSATTAEG